MARASADINAGSMADISFLLLSFFLMTSTMDVSSGLQRKLPPWDPTQQQIDDNKIKERNVFVVLVNKDNQLLVEGEWLNIGQLKEKAKEFIENPLNDVNLPEKELTVLPIIGKYEVSKQVISLQNDRGTSYEMYVKVQNELIAAYTELRDDLSMKTWGVKFDKLSEEKQDVIKEIYPQRISEAEPKNIGGTK